MDIIKNWFKDNSYEVDEYETTLQAKTETNKWKMDVKSSCVGIF